MCLWIKAKSAKGELVQLGERPFFINFSVALKVLKIFLF